MARKLDELNIAFYKRLKKGKLFQFKSSGFVIFCEFLFLIFACRDLLGRLSWIVFVRGLGRPREPCETFRSLSVLSMKEPTKTVKFTVPNSSKSFL